MIKAFVISVFALVLTSASPSSFAQTSTPLPEPTSAASLFKDRPIGALPPPTPTPSPRRMIVEEEEPIPMGWKIGGAIAGAVVGLALLYGAARAWRSSNLFDRQYHFPIGRAAAVRFGGNRCGGHMATINLDRARRSKTEDV